MATSDAQPGPDEQRRRRVGATLGSFGTALEWYDFTLYVYLAPVIADLFFPSSDSLDALLATYGVFAAGFLMRPLGRCSSATSATGAGARRRLPTRW